MLFWCLLSLDDGGVVVFTQLVDAIDYANNVKHHSNCVLAVLAYLGTIK